jgi:hypothetical protein
MEALDLISALLPKKKQPTGERPTDLTSCPSSPEEIVPAAGPTTSAAAGVIATRARPSATTAGTRASSSSYAYGEQEGGRDPRARVRDDLTSPVPTLLGFLTGSSDAGRGRIHPVAVNPDKGLRRECEDRGWETRDFRSHCALAESDPPPRFHPHGRATWRGRSVWSRSQRLLGWVALRSTGIGRVLDR